MQLLNLQIALLIHNHKEKTEAIYPNRAKQEKQKVCSHLQMRVWKAEKLRESSNFTSAWGKKKSQHFRPSGNWSFYLNRKGTIINFFFFTSTTFFSHTILRY